MKALILGTALLLAAVQDEAEKKSLPQDAPAVQETALKPGLCADFYFIGGEIKKMPNLVDMKPALCRMDGQINYEQKDGWGFRELQWKEYFCAVWSGFVRVPKDTKVTFYLKSDDGSKLWVNGKLLIDNDGTHGMDEDSKAVQLKAGDHDFRVEYFQNKDKAGCMVSWKYDGIEKQVIPASAFWHKFNKEIDGEVK